MSKLETLIQQLCPDGVEYKKLGDIATITRGGNLQKKDFTDTGIPCIHYGQIYTKYGLFADKTFTFISEQSASKKKYAEPNDIVMAVTSENLEDVCKCVAWLGDVPAAVSGHTAIIHHSQNPKYLCYYFHSSHFQNQKNRMAHGTKVIEVTPNKLTDILLPVPPLEIQREIVRVLDNFTELTEELESKLSTEVIARKQQFEYYINSQLKFDDSVPRVRLGDICAVITKGTTPKCYAKNGISFIKTEAINGSQIIRNKLSYISEKEHETILKRSILQENDILITIAGATIGKCVIIPKDVLPANTNQALAIIRLSNGICPQYILNILQSSIMRDYINKNVKGSAQPNLNLKQLNEFVLPLPDVNVQEKLTKSLLHLKKMYYDLEGGLTAEVTTRQKQYEYYRDKLLTFKPLT